MDEKDARTRDGHDAAFLYPVAFYPCELFERRVGFAVDSELTSLFSFSFKTTAITAILLLVLDVLQSEVLTWVENTVPVHREEERRALWGQSLCPFFTL